MCWTVDVLGVGEEAHERGMEEGKEVGKDAQNQTQDWEEKTEKKFIEEKEYEVWKVWEI